ncbi:MAG TPA: hypothetical protein VM735_10515 [Candidatus Kapabacteria bacterium]|nr:hypothetical protein [Candidatus Kapabacteria bacterium]
MTPKNGRILHSAAAVILATASLFPVTAAEGDITVLRTEGVLSTYTQNLNPVPAIGAQFIDFQFGFATDEEVQPVIFLDSLTFTLEGTVSGRAAAMTLDREGAHWAPTITGGLTLDPQSFEEQSIPFPGEISPSHTYPFAFSLRAPIPEELRGEDLQFHMDLFSNGNGVESLSWVGPVMVVPEPKSMMILLIGAIFYFGFKWRAR